jgi:hypothetical protein
MVGRALAQADGNQPVAIQAAHVGPPLEHGFQFLKRQCGKTAQIAFLDFAK